MIINLRGQEIDCELEMDGYKVLDVLDPTGRSLLYDYGLTIEEEMAVYRQAEALWTDQQAAYADYLVDRWKDGDL